MAGQADQGEVLPQAPEAMPHVLEVVYFYPRGGSAQVVLAYLNNLPHEGWQPTVVAGSYGPAGSPGNAETFYAGHHVVSVDYTKGQESPDPSVSPYPTMASYEDKPGVPDIIMMRVDPEQYERMVADWEQALVAAGIEHAQVVHLHHLTPAHEAAIRLKKRLGSDTLHLVTSLHGTEMLMLEEYQRGQANWPHAAAWSGHMQRWIEACDRVFLVSDDQVARAHGLFPGLPLDRFLVLSHGVNTNEFQPKWLSPDEQRSLWHQFLVADPQGWKPGEQPGSIRYTDEQIERLIAQIPEQLPLMTVGRFTALKDLPRLIEGYARAKKADPTLMPLVLVGGYPGEYEGEHPYEAAQRLGLRDGHDIFFVGWHDHNELPDLFNAASVFFLTSNGGELFGLVVAEAMACGVPAIVTNLGGQAKIVTDGVDGIHVPVRDPQAIADAIERLRDDPALRVRMGQAALQTARDRYSWPAQVHRLAVVFRTLDGVPADR